MYLNETLKNVNMNNITQVDNDMFYGDQLSKLGMYTLMNQSSKVFKESLMKADKNDLKYTVFSNRKEVKDPQKIKEKEKEFEKEQEEFKNRVSKWKKENEDLFIASKVVPNVSKYCSKEVNNNFIEKIEDPDIAYYLFRTYQNELDNFMEENKDVLKTSTRMVVDPQYSDQFNKFKSQLMKELGLPTNKEIKEMVEETVMQSTQSLRRKKVDHNTMNDEKKEEAKEYSVDYISTLIENFKNYDEEEE